ncbi:hypothetical protein K437DRAFT_293616 [Tilletiaria anomala UBC 951]|uniref:BD-FAE-like domain-containing protein n=1 Tax=Tilletiaria anomala (strain ATCC 24038 / CBS 436.72 / UBC 951) TaxID=1037660 RepID=A0A066WH85_TILAU|nr:uncharacterized protein K437DRAFT_293616 [Tilletiaria anomala UBC 951]KDN50409.1 hypothetical protein K437DRAFT_293616 [Tilletiaria anomala UBC 951]
MKGKHDSDQGHDEIHSSIMRKQPTSTASSLNARRLASRFTISSFVSLFLRAFLIPIIVCGVPAWPVLGMLCIVPIVGMFTVPIFLLLTVTLMYSIAWLSYLVLAQSDPPPAPSPSSLLANATSSLSNESGASGDSPASGSSSNGNGSSSTHYLPFLPYSPLRCLKINWAALQYASTLLRVALPAIFDWSYRRVMVLGSQGGGGIVKENILYGSPSPGKRLDVYIPPAKPSLAAAHEFEPSATAHSYAASSTSAPLHGQGTAGNARMRKHSTMQFNEPPSAPLGSQKRLNGQEPHDPNSGAGPAAAAVIVLLPSLIPPLSWTSKRKTYMQLALRLRRMGYCVVVPELTYFPASRIKASVIDLRIVLHWVDEHIAHYGGDRHRIHLMGHGLSAHLALLLITQQAVVLSREKFLDDAWEREQQQEEEAARLYAARRNDYGENGQDGNRPEEDDDTDARLSPPEEGAKVRGDRAQKGAGAGGEPLSQSSLARHEAELARQKQQEEQAAQHKQPRRHTAARQGSEHSNSWVDEDLFEPNSATARDGGLLTEQEGSSSILPPGMVSTGKEKPAGVSTLPFPADNITGAAMSSEPKRTYPRCGSQQEQRLRNHRNSTAALAAAAQLNNHAGSLMYGKTGLPPQTLSEAEAAIGQGLRQVSIYGAHIPVPPVAGVILLAGISDVIKGFRSESERGVEHLSVLRRAMGPGHTSCLLHSPAHLLYAAKHILDIGLLPPKFLLIHGGRDAVVPIEQSTLLKTLLVGVGVEHIKLRAYRELGHVEALAACFLGMGQSFTRYRKSILADLQGFVQL